MFKLIFIVPILINLWASSPTRADMGDRRQAELIHLLKHDCGSCHGMTMKGGLGKPLSVKALANRDVQELTDIILEGIPGTPMPPWQKFLNPNEVRWIVRVLKDGSLKQ